MDLLERVFDTTIISEWTHQVILDRDGNYHLWWTPLEDKIVFQVQVWQAMYSVLVYLLYQYTHTILP